MDDGMLLLPQNDDGRSIRPDTPNQPRRRPLPSTLHPHQTLIRPSISPECSRSTPPKGVWDARKVIFITSRSCLSILRLRRRLQTSARLPTHQTQRAPPIDRSIDRFRSGRSTWCRALCVHGLSAQSIDRNRSIKACGINPEHPPHERARVQRAMPAHSSPGPPCPKPRGIQPHSHGLHARGGAVPGLQWPLTFWAAHLRALLVLVDRFWYNAPNASLARSVVVVCLTLSPNPRNPNHKKTGSRPARPRKCSSVI